MRGRRLHRLLQLIALLRGASSWNARRLAHHFQTTRRNIHRDMAVLELAGVPFWYDPDFGEGGGYRIRESFFFPNIGLTDQECYDLAVLTKVATNEGIPLVGEACHVRDKLFGTLPAKQQALILEASELFDFLSVGLADQSRCHRIMHALQQAVLAKKQVEGVYQSPHEKRAKKVRLQPRRVFLCNHVWYLAAHDNQASQTKLFRLARFHNLKVFDTPMNIDPHFSLRDFLGNAWSVRRGDRDYHVEILFDPEAAPLVSECRWHQTQECEEQKDGSLLFRATVSGLEEIRHWVLTWGPQAKIIRPTELIQEVQDLARQTWEQYASKRKTNQPKIPSAKSPKP